MSVFVLVRLYSRAKLNTGVGSLIIGEINYIPTRSALWIDRPLWLSETPVGATVQTTLPKLCVDYDD